MRYITKGRRVWLSGGLIMLVVALVATVTTRIAAGQTGATPIKIGILSDCKGAFGAFHEQNIGGAISAFAQVA